MTRPEISDAWIGIVAAVLLTAALLAMGRSEPIAAYEREYHRTDEPAYHATPVKRLLGLFHQSDSGAEDSIKTGRIIAVGHRVLGLLAFLGLLRIFFNRMTSLAAVTIFLILPPTMPHLVRLDSWMDSVGWALMGLFGLALADRDIRFRRPPGAAPEGRPFTRFLPFVLAGSAGAMLALALDAKLTSALTIVPALVFFSYASRTWKGLPAVFLGALIGFAAAQPGWFFHPQEALRHVGYWRASNETLMNLPIFHPMVVLGAAVPASIWVMAALEIRRIGAERSTLMSVVLAVLPAVFFMIYRTVPAEGVRHLFLVLPFVSTLAAAGWVGQSFRVKLAALCALGIELSIRLFPQIAAG